MPVEDKGQLPKLAFDAEITAGIHAEEGAVAHGDGVTNADIGMFHEFGYGPPKRSWLRAYFDENESRLGAAFEDAIADAIVSGRDVEHALRRIAAMIEGEIKERIYASIPPEPSKPVKEARGESAVPLIDTGQLISAIRAEVQLRFRIE